MNLPPRWQPLLGYFQALLDPVVAAGAAPWFAIEASGPDGEPWTSHHRRYVDLRRRNPALDAVRAVATVCGATVAAPDPGPEGQEGHGVDHCPAALDRRWREDRVAVALAAILLDLDDRDHGGRDGCHRALAPLPRPTALLHSGGGVQVAFVLREALVFDRRDEASLTAVVRRYLSVVLPLQAASDADQTGWPSHLFRCPGTYHLKIPARPVLLRVDLEPDRRFNLGDFEEFAGGVDDATVEAHTEKLVARLLGREERLGSLGCLAPLATVPGRPGEKPRVVLPRRVSPATIRLLNQGRHPKYERADGSLDRSRAVYAAALSLLGAGLPEEEVASAIAVSALRPALEDRGDDALRWLSFQVAAAKAYLDKNPSKRRRA